MQPDRCCICGGGELDLAFPGSTASPTSAQLAPSRHHPGEHPEMYRCLRCGTWQAAAAEADLEAAYRDMSDEAYIAEERARRVTCRRLLDRAARMLGDDPSPRVLDVGCGPGLLLDEAQRRGWRPYGVELSSWGVERTRAHGVEVFHGTLEEAAFPDGAFDAVFLIDVIEHLADPIRALKEVTRVLRPGGTLCLVTPDASSVTAKVLGSRWWAMLPGHIVLFSHRVLGEILASLGYEIRTHRLGAKHFSLDYLLGGLSTYAPPAEPLASRLRSTRLARRVLPVNFFDERVVVATRLRSTADAPSQPSGLVLPRAASDHSAYTTTQSLLPEGFAAWTVLPRSSDVTGARRIDSEHLGARALRSYGATQKAALLQAAQHRAAAVVVKADNAYDQKVVADLAAPVLSGEADLALGVRRFDDPLLRSRVPRWKRLGNRTLSAVERSALGLDVADFHSGYRAVSPAFLEQVPFLRNSDGLVFDSETVIQTKALGLRVVPVPLDTAQFIKPSPVGPVASVGYGLRTLAALGRYAASRAGLRWQLLAPAWHSSLIQRAGSVTLGGDPVEAPSTVAVGDPVEPAVSTVAVGGNGPLRA